MKRNKPETHFRLKPYLKKWIDEIAKLTKSTMTSVVEDALEKGLSWRIKMIRKELDPEFLLKKPDQARNQLNNKTKEPEPEEEPISDEEVKKMLDDLYKEKKPKRTT